LFKLAGEQPSAILILVISVLSAAVVLNSEIFVFAIFYPCRNQMSVPGKMSVQVSVPAVIVDHVSEEGDIADHVSEPADTGVHVSAPGLIGFHPELKPIKELKGAWEKLAMPNIYCSLFVCWFWCVAFTYPF
jgi:hypothetical protein